MAKYVPLKINEQDSNNIYGNDFNNHTKIGDRFFNTKTGEIYTVDYKVYIGGIILRWAYELSVGSHGVKLVLPVDELTEANNFYLVK